MALASIFGTNLFNYQPDGIIEFYDTYPAVREVFEQAAEWTGVPAQTLLRQDAEPSDEERRLQISSVGLAAAQLGIHDVLVEKGIRPAVAGGLSLGGMVGACVSGALSRQDLISLLFRGGQRAEQHEDGRPQGVASAFVPLDYDADWYFGEQREGVWLGGDFGLDASERCHVLLLTGYRDALEKLAGEAPPKSVVVSDDGDLAVHSPLRTGARDETRRQVEQVRFTDPGLRLCSCVEQRTLTTGDEVREMFVRNVVEPVSNVHLHEEMKANGTRLGLVVGPSLIKDLLKFPFPVVYVDRPAAVPEAVAAIFEHGVEIEDA